MFSILRFLQSTFVLSLQIQYVFYTYNTAQFGLATLQVLNSQM